MAVSTEAHINEPREGRWLAKPLKPRRRFVEVMSWGGFLVLPLGLYVQFGPWPGFVVRAVAAGLAFVAYYAALLILPFLDLVARRRTRRDRALSDGASRADEYSVELVVWNGTQRVGADRGVV